LILHVEHQSKPDRLYPLRNALYDISAVKDYVDQHKSKNLPVPISLLYYHGKPTPYPHTIDIMEMFSNKEIADHRFLKPFLVDLGQFSDQELLSHKEIGGFEISYKHTYDKCISEENVVNLVQALRNCNNIELQRAWYRYTINTWDAEKDSMLNIYKEIIPDGEDFAMTVAEQLKKEGEARGKLQGIKEKANEMAIDMLKFGDSVEKVAKIAKLSIIKVQELKKSIKH
jgi:predicted transposase/invertase (TIGR01784 family)